MTAFIMGHMLRVVLVIVDTVPPGDAEKLVGTIADLNVETRSFTLIPSAGDPICVLVPEDIDIFLLIEEIEKLNSHLIDLGDLENGEEVTVFGSFESDGAGPCFIPGTILIFSG